MGKESTTAATGHVIAGASTSFRKQEIDAICQLFETLYRGGSPGTVVRAQSVQSVYGKFKRMQVRVRGGE
jgi:HPt (histidine-containing phosphotransfer) domain-containing protein